MNAPATPTPTRIPTLQRKLAVWIGCAIVVPVALKWGYSFGNPLGGMLLGLVTAANTALMGALLVDWVVNWVADRLHR